MVVVITVLSPSLSFLCLSNIFVIDHLKILQTIAGGKYIDGVSETGDFNKI